MKVFMIAELPLELTELHHMIVLQNSAFVETSSLQSAEVGNMPYIL
jgi:hypothetical protein